MLGSADVTQVLCELELTIRRVKVSTTPDGRVMDLFFITDARFYDILYLVVFSFWFPQASFFLVAIILRMFCSIFTNS